MDFYINEVIRVTEKQKRFCDEYLIDLNATRAYKAAYPNVLKQRTAESAGNRLLSNVEVQEYIQKRLAEKEDALIAKQDEILKTLTRIMRREELETVVVTCKKRKSYYDDDGRKVIDDAEEPVMVSVPTKVSDTNKAAEMLGKYYALFTDKTQLDGGSAVVIINDIPRGEDNAEAD